MIKKYTFIIIVGLYLSCTSSPKNSKKEAVSTNIGLLKHNNTIDSIRSRLKLHAMDSTKQIQDSILFFKEHIEPASDLNFEDLSSEEKFKYTYLLSNDQHSFIKNDSSFSFSNNLKTRIEFSVQHFLITRKYNLFIYNNNLLVGTTIVNNLAGQEGGFDEFIPFENGKGFIQIAALGEDESSNVHIYAQNVKNKKYEEVFNFISDDIFVEAVAMSGNSKYFAIQKLYNDFQSISKYDINGNLIFEKKFLNDRLLSISLNISPDGEFISFSYSETDKDKNRKKMYSVLNKVGNVIINVLVVLEGNYTSNFVEFKEKTYLIAEGHFAYIFDFENKCLIREIREKDPEMSAYKLFIEGENLYCFFITYVFNGDTRVQGDKIIGKFDIATGAMVSSLEIPLIQQIYFFCDKNQLYFMNKNSNKKIYKFKF